MHNGTGIGTKAPYRNRDKSNRQELYAEFGTGAGDRSRQAVYRSRDRNRKQELCIHKPAQKKETGAGTGSGDRSCIQELGQEHEIAVYWSRDRSRRQKL